MRLTAIFPMLLWCCIATLAGCWTPDPRVNYGHVDKLQASFPEEDRALVIFWAEVLQEGPLGRLDESGSMYFRLKKPVTFTEKDKPVEKIWFHYFAGADLKAASVYPGEYAIESFHYLRGNSSGTLSTTAWDRETGKPSIFGFYVAPGEVVYLGHLQMIKIDDRAYQATLSVSNREDEAREFVKEEFGGKAGPILPKMQTRLLKVPAEAF